MSSKIKYGLKLWSHNESDISQAESLHEKGFFNYIELYVVPGTFKKCIDSWRQVKIPYIIHCTHCMHGFNLALKGKSRDNLNIFSEVKAFCDELKSKYIILHPGIKGSLQNTVEQLKCLRDKRLLVENMPYLSMFGDRCMGSLYEDVESIISTCNVGFCLDIPHAINAAFHEKKDYFDYTKKMLDLNPEVIHISDGRVGDRHDEHLHIGKGDFDFRLVKEIVDASKAKYLTLETPKGKKWASDFIADTAKMNRESLNFRQALNSDCHDLWRWRNHPKVRQWSFRNKRIEFERHKKWFRSKIKDDDTAMYVVENEKQDKIGQVRFEKDCPTSARINVNLNPEFFGRSLGSHIIEMTTEQFETNNPEIREIIAEILDGNIAARKAFEKAGYTFFKRSLKRDKKMLVYNCS